MTMNAYEQKIADRKQRRLDRAHRLRAEGDALYKTASTMASVIPFGQPIHVGHHSEGRDRSYRKRIHNKFGKAFETMELADKLEERANTTTNAISADDPDAITKLQAKLDIAKANQTRMVTANRLLRKKDFDGLKAMGFDEAAIANLQKPDSAGRTGFPDYALSNNNANIKRLEGRVAQLTRAKAKPTEEVTQDGFVYKVDRDENRVMFIFPGKPDEAVRTILKREAFKWSPNRGAWVRQITPAAINAGQYVINRLAELKTKETNHDQA